MKTKIFDEAEFDHSAFVKSLGDETVHVKVRHKDGTRSSYCFTPSGQVMSVGQLREMCLKSASKKLAQLKLDSVKMLGESIEVVIPKDQVIKLTEAPKPATK
jgi:hypothetical protein